MPGVFISYRREDSSGYAGRLFDILSVHFGRENTYMDVDTIMGGDNFPAVIEEKISHCDALLAVIGERWLTCTAAKGGRRLDMAGDFVRLEIAKALERGVRVIPVLVGGATMPHQGDLPDELRPLCAREAMDLRDAHFRADAERLIDTLKKTVPGIANRRWEAKSKRFLLSVSLVLVVAAVVGGILLSRQPKKPAAGANPDSASQKQIAPPNGTIRANPGSASQKQSAPANGTIRANPDSASQKQIAPANGPIAPVRANPAEADKSKSPAKGPTDVAGKWTATVKYWDEATHRETFNFEVAGTELSGTASFLEESLNIFDGKVEGDRISFMTKSLTGFDGKTYVDKQYYKGTVEGDTIRFSMAIDSSVSQQPPYHFTATRSGVK
jgi:hypothetical protein